MILSVASIRGWLLFCVLYVRNSIKIRFIVSRSPQIERVESPSLAVKISVSSAGQLCMADSQSIYRRLVFSIFVIYRPPIDLFWPLFHHLDAVRAP